MIPPRDNNAHVVAPPPANSLPMEPAATAPPIVMGAMTAVDPPLAPAATTATPSPDPAPTSSTPDDRATSFQPVEGGPGESRSGETLLVEAYVVIWVILMGWLYLVWRRQSALSAQLDDLEKTIAKAASAGAKGPRGQGAKGEEKEKK